MKEHAKSKDKLDIKYMLLKKKLPQRVLEKGSHMFFDSSNSDLCYYIVEGKLLIELLAANGKRIRVDILQKGDFVIPRLYLQGYNLQCRWLVQERVEAFLVRKEELQGLLLQPDFAVCYYKKESIRLQAMYGLFLARSLFAPKEIIANYILQKESNGCFVYTSLYELRILVGISRRGLYNVLHEFEQKGYLIKEKRKYRIVDQQSLIRVSEMMQTIPLS